MESTVTSRDVYYIIKGEVAGLGRLVVRSSSAP